MSEHPRESMLIPSASTEIDGSYINVFDTDAILEAAREQRGVTIFKSRDFPYPISSMVANANLSSKDGQDRFILTATISIDQSTEGREDEWEEYFHNYFAHKGPGHAIYREENDVAVYPAGFPEIFRIIDRKNNGHFVVEIKRLSDEIRISNNLVRWHGNECYRIDAPNFEDRSPLSQLESLGRVLAFTADFAATIDSAVGCQSSYKPKHLGRNYNFGPDSKTFSAYKARQVGSKALVAINEGNVTETSGPEQAGSDTERKWPLLSDIGGLCNIKRELQDVITALSHPEIVEKWGAEIPRVVLLYGEPGTGKTMLVRALANELDADMEEVMCTDIFDSLVGKSAKQLESIFSRAKESENTVILFFDKFDELISTDRDKGTESSDHVASLLKKEIEELARENHNIVIVAAAKNKDGVVHPNSFDLKLYLPMPDASARSEIIVNIISRSIVDQAGFNIFADDINVGTIAEETEGFSGGDVAKLFRRLKVKKALMEARQHSGVGPITQSEILAEITKLRTEL